MPCKGKNKELLQLSVLFCRYVYLLGENIHNPGLFVLWTSACHLTCLSLCNYPMLMFLFSLLSILTKRQEVWGRRTEKEKMFMRDQLAGLSFAVRPPRQYCYEGKARMYEGSKVGVKINISLNVSDTIHGCTESKSGFSK